MKMDMTVPVIKVHFKESVRMCFMVPSELAQNAPTPTESNVFMYTNPEDSQLYVR